MDHPDRHDHGGDVIQHLRRAAAARVRSRPLRHVARQTGMSPAGLKNFLGSCSFGSAIARVKVAENVDEPLEDLAPGMHREKPEGDRRDP
jgi:hypothetical protein